jgi:hypothetical protein
MEAIWFLPNAGVITHKTAIDVFTAVMNSDL